jgi:glycosyltransferase involved in cell wall biosynthesis
MKQRKITLISGEGDPADPRTWSGTLYNLIGGFKTIGCGVTGVNLLPPRLLRAAFAALTLVTGYGREFRRTRFFSHFSNLKISKSAGADSVFLHMGYCTIPFRRKQGDGYHAAYLDTTFNQISRYVIKPYSDALYRKYENLEKAILQAADHVFTVSECAREDLIDHYALPPEKVTHAGTGFGMIQPWEGKRDYSSRTILFVAKQRFEEKGGLLLLEGFRLAQARDPRLKLVVVATEPYRSLVEAIPGTEFRSGIPWKELEGLFNTSSLFAMPAIREPWGLVYLEALACRTPILGLNRNAVPEFTQHGKFGFMVDEPSVESVASALCEALSDTERLANMGCLAQKHVQNFYSWDRTAMRIANVLFQK